MMKDVLFVMALECECPSLLSQTEVLLTGVGKVNAAMSLTKHLSTQAPPKLIVNIGTAGGLRVKAGSVVNATRFIQRDMEAVAIGFERWQTPFEAAGPLCNGLRIEGFQSVMCGTGDSFETGGADAPFDIVDMEAYALAKVAAAFGAPFACLKYISDGAGDGAASDWVDALEHSGPALIRALSQLGQSQPVSTNHRVGIQMPSA